jgi:hypothetical protein
MSSDILQVDYAIQQEQEQNLKTALARMLVLKLFYGLLFSFVKKKYLAS